MEQEKTMERPKVEHMHFTIDGDFVTELARTWFWEEDCPYEKSEKLLKSCLVNEQTTDAERDQIVRDIIEGRKKLTGSSDEGLSLEDDGENIRPITLKIKETEKKLFIEMLKNRMEYDFLPFVDPFSTVKSIKSFRRSNNGERGIDECRQYFLYVNEWNEDSFMQEIADKTTKGGLWLYEEPELIYEIMQEMYPDTKPDINMVNHLGYTEPGCFWDILYEKIKNTKSEDFIERNERYLGAKRVARRKELKELQQDAEMRKTFEEKKETETKSPELIEAEKYREEVASFLKRQLSRIKDGTFGENIKEHADFYEFEYNLINEQLAEGENSNKNEYMYEVLPDPEIKDAYGLCDPQGNWYSTGFGGHNMKAVHMIYVHPENFPEMKPGHIEMDAEMFNDSKALDLLIKKGWCAIRCSQLIGDYVTTPMDAGSAKQLTKAQKDAIWDVIAKHEINIDTSVLM